MLTDLPLFAALKHKMRWHETRQTVLAQNVANAETPGYEARDLDAPDFRGMLAATRAQATGVSHVQPAGTNAMHMTGRLTAGEMTQDTIDTFETTPKGNTVVLEEEMMRVADNQMQHQMAVSLYQKGLGLLRMALGSGR